MNDFSRRNFEMIEAREHVFIDGSSGVVPRVQMARKTGSPTVIAESASGKIALHSLFSPEAEAQKWVSTRDIKSDANRILIYGFGFGYHIEALMAARPELRYYVVDAAPEVFKAAAAHRDLTSLLSSPNLKLIVGPPLEICEVFKDIVEVISDNSEKSAMAIHKPSVDILPPDAEWLKYALEMQMLENSLSSGGRVMSELSERNAGANREAFADSRSVREIHGMFEGWPIIVAATGPSLDYSVRVMSRAASLPLIIALDSSLKPLLAEGIRPDFVITGDPQDSVAKMFHGADLDGIRLIFFRRSCPEVVDMFAPSNRYAAEILRLEKGGIYDPKEGELFFCGTIFSAGVDFAVRCGGRPIILVGADFSFTQSRTHATGGSEIQQVTPRFGKTTTIKGIDGNPVMTSQIFNIYLSDFEDYCRTLSHKTDFINCTAHGAEIRGLPHFGLAETLVKYTS